MSIGSNMTEDSETLGPNFDDWLNRKLADLDVDAEVYGSYIKGILEEEQPDGLKDALEDILSSFVEDPADLCEQVLSKWKPFNEAKLIEPEETKKNTIEDIIAAHSAKVMVEKPNVEKTFETDIAIKRALLDKYSEVYDEVAEEEGDEKKPAKAIAPVTLGLFENVNIKAVTAAEKQKRDKQKEDHMKKKEKDKLDREKQKLKKEERKEKEKKRTQKKERPGR